MGNEDLYTARVTAVHKERYELLYEDRRIFGKLKMGIYLQGTELYPTTGDYVQIMYNNMGDSMIVKTLERTSYFSRLDPDKTRPHEQAVAANFDYVFIMASLNHDFNPKRIERYLALSWQSGAVPVVILTKSDLTDNFDEQVSAVESVAAGVDICAISSVTGDGLSKLDKYLKHGKTIVFLGSSGVGKSSLANALFGEDIMAVSGIRDDDSKGRHTTTHRQLITLPNGVMIIDTPGMRELGMWDVSTGLGEAFADVEAYFGKCKFSDCEHKNEPGCAVIDAIKSGDLPKERLNSYLKLKREAQYVEKKAAYMSMKAEKNKSIAKWSRKNKHSKAQG